MRMTGEGNSWGQSPYALRSFSFLKHKMKTLLPVNFRVLLALKHNGSLKIYTCPLGNFFFLSLILENLFALSQTQI